jgi:hypothetical protein
VAAVVVARHRAVRRESATAGGAEPAEPAEPVEPAER